MRCSRGSVRIPRLDFPFLSRLIAISTGSGPVLGVMLGPAVKLRSLTAGVGSADIGVRVWARTLLMLAEALGLAFRAVCGAKYVTPF